MERLVKDLSQSTLVSQHFLESEIDAVKNSLGLFLNLVPKYRSTLRVSTMPQIKVPSIINDSVGWSRTVVQSTPSSEAADIHR